MVVLFLYNNSPEVVQHHDKQQAENAGDKYIYVVNNRKLLSRGQLHTLSVFFPKKADFF